MRAGELCIREVFTAQRDESVAAVARRMSDLNVGDLIVVDDQETSRPIGIITDRDLVVHVLARSDRIPIHVKVGDVMSPELVTAREDDDIETVVARLRMHAIRRIPVVDREGRLQGIVSLDDLLDWIGEQVAAMSRLVRRQQPTDRAL
jgi:CBS domain-containing protein